jgi:hypothetical protein
MAPFMEAGDVLGQETMGVVEEVGAEVTGVVPGDRVVIPFNIACGGCFMCEQGLQSQCETTQVRSEGIGAALFGYARLYGAAPGGQAEYLRVPHADYGPIKVPDGPPDDRFVYLSDVLPTAWQRSSTPPSHPAGAWSCSGSGRWATPGGPPSGGRLGHRRRRRSRTAGPGPGAGRGNRGSQTTYRRKFMSDSRKSRDGRPSKCAPEFGEMPWPWRSTSIAASLTLAVRSA